MVALIAMISLAQDPERDALVAKADAAIHAAAAAAAADPDRPAYHYRAPAQWMNDPNGTIFYKGWYHLFYQAHPFAPGSGPKYWGHARSRDLVHWEDLPTALWPSQARGENEIWSGSVFLNGAGKPVAFYTSIGPREPEQWIATPEDDDLIRWRKDPVKITQAVNGDKPIAEWRDPFLFRDLGLPFLVTGGGHDGKGIVALYRSTSPDLRGWQYLGDCFTHPDADVRNVECPNLFPVGDDWVLLTSTHGKVEAFVGELRNTHFVTRRRSVLAEGSYASQIFENVEARAVEIAWVPTQEHPAWTGYLTLPSELTVAKDGTLLSNPVKELTKLRQGTTKLGTVEIDGDHALPEGNSLEFELTLDPGTATRAGIRLRSNTFEVAYEPATHTLSAGGRCVTLDPKRVQKGVKLRIFLDRTALDVYADDGAAVLIAHVAHAATEALSNVLFAEGGRAKATGMTIHPLALKG